jgi:putative ABC transport system permease protein
VTYSAKRQPMIKNYLRVAFRNLWRHKGFSLLNIIGLTVGMAAFFLVFLYVTFELSYDSFHSKADRIYRVVSDVQTPTGLQHFNNPPVPATIGMKKQLPEIEMTTRVSLGDNWMVIRDKDVFETGQPGKKFKKRMRMQHFPGNWVFLVARWHTVPGCR